jgi:hypothetical protein
MVVIGIVPSSTEVQQEHQGAASDLVAKLGAFYLHFDKELFSTAAERVAKNNGDPVLINAKLRARYGADLSYLNSFGSEQGTAASDTVAEAKTVLARSSTSPAQRSDVKGGLEQDIGATNSWPAKSSWQADDKWRLQQPRRRPRRQLQS